MNPRIWIATALMTVGLGLITAAAQTSPSSDMLSDVVTVTVIRLSGVASDPKMTELENLTSEQQEGMIALRASIAGNVKVREALAEAGVTDVNAIVGAQIRAGGNLTVYVR